MEREEIKELKCQFDELVRSLPEESIEFWFAREIQEPLGYFRWENFITVIKRAIESCKTTGYNPIDHFRGVTKKVNLGSGAERLIEDFLPTLTIAAKNLATEMTNHNVLQEDLQGEDTITSEHIQNNYSVREMFGQRGIKPENLPPEEDILKLERRVKSEEKKVVKQSGKLPNLL